MEEAATVLAQLKGQAEALRASGDEAQATQIESLCAAMAQARRLDQALGWHPHPDKTTIAANTIATRREQT